MLNIMNFLVFRITRTVLFSLEAALAAPDLALVVSPVRSGFNQQQFHQAFSVLVSTPTHIPEALASAVPQRKCKLH